MQHQTILNLLKIGSHSIFLARKWNIVNDQSNASYNVGNETICSTEVLKANNCEYKNAYILVRGDITIIGCNFATKVAFKNCTPFFKYIKKIDGTTMDDAEDFYLVMLIYDLSECS